MPAAVGRQLHVCGEQRLQLHEVAALDGREEQSGQLFALLACRLETGTPPRGMFSGAARELTHRWFALAHDRCDFWVAIVEDIAKEQHGALLG